MSEKIEAGSERDIRHAYHTAIYTLIKMVAPEALSAEDRRTFERIKDDHSWDGLSCSCGGGWLVGHQGGCPEREAAQ